MGSPRGTTHGGDDMAKYIELRRHTDDDDDALSEEGVQAAIGTDHGFRQRSTSLGSRAAAAGSVQHCRLVRPPRR